MKITVIIALAFLTSSLSHAAELDVRVVEISGDVTPNSELVRLSEADLLPSTESFTVSIDNPGVFNHPTSRSIKWPTSYNKISGKAEATENRSTGVSFSGSVTSFRTEMKGRGEVELNTMDFEFSRNALQRVQMYRQVSGALMPQPIISSFSIKTSFQLVTNDWYALPLGSAPKGADALQTVVIVRIRR